MRMGVSLYLRHPGLDPGSTTPSPNGCRIKSGMTNRLNRGGELGQSAHIGQQRRRNVDAAVGLLIIFEDRDERPSDRKARPVQRMDERIALHILAAETRVHAACLE